MNNNGTQETNNQGVIIDHKMFANIVNTLAYGVEAGTVSKELFDEVIAIGKQQEPKQESKQQPTEAEEKFEQTINNIVKFIEIGLIPEELGLLMMEKVAEKNGYETRMVETTLGPGMAIFKK